MELRTARLILRDFQADDWPAVLAYQSDRRYLRFYEWTGRTAPAVQQFVAGFVSQQHERPRTRFQLAIALGDQLIGNCGVRVNDSARREGNVGYELDPRHWGRGYATEAASAVLAFGFEQLGLHRVWAECVAENAASARVLEKLGMRREAHFREHQHFKGRWWDTYVYAILDREWQSQLTL